MVYAGILGENLIIPPFMVTKSAKGFTVVNIVTLTVSLLVFAAIHSYLRIKRLLNNPG